MYGIIGAVLLLMWLLGFFAFHVTVGFIHILLVLAVISILYHFVAGRSALNDNNCGQQVWVHDSVKLD